jgi:hypothetical protein
MEKVMFGIGAMDKQAVALQCLQIAFIGNKMGQSEGLGSCIEDPPEDILRLREAASDVLRGYLIQKEEKKEPERSASSVVFDAYVKSKAQPSPSQSVACFLQNCDAMLGEMAYMFSNNAGVPRDEFLAIIAAEALSKINVNMSIGLARLLVNAVREGNAGVMLDSLSNQPGNCPGVPGMVVPADAACDVVVESQVENQASYG